MHLLAGSPEVVVARVGQLLGFGALLRPRVPAVRHCVLRERISAQLLEAHALDAARCALQRETKQSNVAHKRRRTEEARMAGSRSCAVAYSHMSSVRSNVPAYYDVGRTCADVPHSSMMLAPDPGRARCHRRTLKHPSTTAWLRPNASNSCDPLYDATVDTPIFAITCNARAATMITSIFSLLFNLTQGLYTGFHIATCGSLSWVG